MDNLEKYWYQHPRNWTEWTKEDFVPWNILCIAGLLGIVILAALGVIWYSRLNKTF